jgi:hypothetical protein
MPFKKGVKNLTGGRKSFKVEFSLKKNIDKFSPKFWDKLHQMIDEKNVEEYLSLELLSFIGEYFKKNQFMGKQLVEKLAELAAGDKKFAMQEFNKIQVKTIPTDITSGGEKINSLADLILTTKNGKGSEDKT